MSHSTLASPHPAKQDGNGMRDTLSIVISAYNEEGNVEELHRRLAAVTATLSLREVEYIFVDDGSSDGTLRRCLALQAKDPNVKIVRLIRNFGHESAMIAGMDYARGDAIIFMDADLQHPPEYVAEMVALWRQGHDAVLTRRVGNADTSPLYKFLAKTFYRILNSLSDTHIPANTPDFRLLDRKYVNYLKTFDERDSLFRGVLAWCVDMKTLPTIEFTSPERVSGVSKYNFRKSLRLALNSILQFSIRPLHLAFWLTGVAALFALILGAHVVIEFFFKDHPTPGFATTIVTMLVMNTITLLVLAIIGAYIAKIHMETKKRPLYLADYLTADAPANMPPPPMPPTSSTSPMSSTPTSSTPTPGCVRDGGNAAAPKGTAEVKQTEQTKQTTQPEQTPEANGTAGTDVPHA